MHCRSQHFCHPETFLAAFELDSLRDMPDGELLEGTGLDWRMEQRRVVQVGGIRPALAGERLPRSLCQVAHDRDQIRFSLKPDTWKLWHCDVTVDHLHLIRKSSIWLEQVWITFVSPQPKASRDVQ